MTSDHVVDVGSGRRPDRAEPSRDFFFCVSGRLDALRHIAASHRSGLDCSSEGRMHGLLSQSLTLFGIQHVLLHSNCLCSQV